jgi:bifunctional non-homologous end joining protein LigD
MSEYILVKHDAKKAGLHYDLRFEKPNDNVWLSFATTNKESLPPENNNKMTLVKTTLHTRDEALFTGTIERGSYGAGKITKIEKGKCKIIKFSNEHIVVDFKGNKLKGKYHFVNTKKFSSGKDKKLYVFFKAKNKGE